MSPGMLLCFQSRNIYIAHMLHARYWAEDSVNLDKVFALVELLFCYEK